MKGGGNMVYRGAVTPNHKVTDFYSLGRVLGKGAYGKVYLGTNLLSGDKFAIKEIKYHPKMNIEKEIKFMQRLANPNLITYYEYFETRTDKKNKKKIYLVIQRCLGGELFDVITSLGKLTEAQSKTVMYQLFQGIQYMHKVGIMHRDLKPENILLAKRGSLKDIRIIDFGLSIEINENDNSKVGTPYYMAPEIIKKDYGSECDIWSLGVIMYILLCGYPPFNGPDDNSILNKIKLGSYSFDSEDWKGISESAQDLIVGLLTYSPFDRITLSEALGHRWFTGFDPSRDISKPVDTHEIQLEEQD